MKVIYDFDLTDYNSYKIKSRCEKAVFCDTELEIQEYYMANRNKFPILLGSGHNVIFSKEYYSEDFLIFNGNFSKVSFQYNDIVIAEAGCSMIEMSQMALSNSLSGLEIFYDIPSSLGGAVVMNAGASGEEIKDLIIKVRYLDLEDFLIKEISNKEIDFTYRNSFFQKNKNKVVLKTWLQLKKDDFGTIKRKMETIKSQRWSKQPKELPNAGSVFKRPPGFYVGAMIDDLNLKGYSVGGAKISEKHGGFIVNYNNATGKDIIQLINDVKKLVQNRFKVDLEIEQRII